jgi:hypothetical protein
MAQIKLLAHITVEVDDADRLDWEMTESCAPTALRNLLKQALRDSVVKIRTSDAPGVVSADEIAVEWPGDHAMRVVMGLRQGAANAKELGLNALEEGSNTRRGRMRMRTYEE